MESFGRDRKSGQRTQPRPARSRAADRLRAAAGTSALPSGIGDVTNLLVMTTHRLADAVSFMRTFARRQAHRVVDVPGGFAVLNETFAASYDHNKLVLTGPVEPSVALAAADRVLGGAGLTHRTVYVDDDGRGLALAPAFLVAGYHHAVHLVMCHTGAEPDRPADPAIRVSRVDLDTLRESSRKEWREQLPHASDAAIGQLVERRSVLLRGADEVVFLAVLRQGVVVSRADLYLDAATGTAQIEDVMTNPAYTGRGYARAVMAEGLRRARAAGCDLVFVVADAREWPRHLYSRLGYATAGRTHLFTLPSPGTRSTR